MYTCAASGAALAAASLASSSANLRQSSSSQLFKSPAREHAIVKGESFKSERVKGEELRKPYVLHPEM